MTTYADVMRPESRALARLYDLGLVLSASAFIAVSAHLTVRLPFSPVPVTGQTFAVLLTGALLGRQRGAAAVLAYLAEGLAGLPVFAGGMSGLAYLLGPTGGYLLGFVGAAYLTGALAERGWDRQPLTTALAMVLGNLALYAPGLLWLSRFVGERALALGLWPFLPGDLAKLVLAMLVLPTGWRWLGRR